MTQAKGAWELETFQEFAAVCPLAIDEDSIRAGADPPDILCEAEALGTIGFELVQVEDESIHKGMSEAFRRPGGGGSSFATREPLLRNVENKLLLYGRGRFGEAKRTELLAYYWWVPSWLTSDRYRSLRHELHNLVTRLLPNSAFDRVWVYDHQNREVVFVEPPLETERGTTSYDPAPPKGSIA